MLQALVRGVLRTVEIAWQEQCRDADAADEVSERDLQEGEVTAGREPRYGDHRQGGGFGGDDGKHQRPPGQPTVPEKIVGGVALASR